MALEGLNNWENSEKNTQEPEKLLPEVEKKLSNEIKKDSQEKLSQLGDEKMQNITNEEFLKYSPETRFQSLARNPQGEKITADQIISGEISDVEFQFAFEKNQNGEKVVNQKLEFLTTAGQILPQQVATVICEWVEYSRENLKGEFFAQDGSRLVIFDETKLIISEIRDEKQMAALEKKAEEKLQEFMKDEEENKNISPEEKKARKQFAKEWIIRGFDPDFIMKIFAGLFLGLGKLEKALGAGEWENWFTQLDRKLWGMNDSWVKIDKSNISQENQQTLIDEMSLPKSLPAPKYSPYPQLDNLADRYNIEPSLLYSIWASESISGHNLNFRTEQSGVTSYGMFQILDSHFIQWGETDLLQKIKNNPGDRELNIQALEMYFQNKPKVVSALQSWDFHMIATYYNGGWYQKWARENNAVAYDQKLRYYQIQYNKWKASH